MGSHFEQVTWAKINCTVWGRVNMLYLPGRGEKKNYLHFYVFRWFQWFRFSGFIPMFRVLVHAVKRIHMSNKVVVVVIAVITIR